MQSYRAAAYLGEPTGSSWAGTGNNNVAWMDLEADGLPLSHGAFAQLYGAVPGVYHSQSSVYTLTRLTDTYRIMRNNRHPVIACNGFGDAPPPPSPPSPDPPPSPPSFSFSIQVMPNAEDICGGGSL